jgi:C4-type Zn-finger protein
MPSTQQPDPPKPPPVPTCPHCGRPMRLAYAEQAYFYKDIVDITYTCECGKTASEFSPVKEEAGR